MKDKYGNEESAIEVGVTRPMKSVKVTKPKHVNEMTVEERHRHELKLNREQCERIEGLLEIDTIQNLETSITTLIHDGFDRDDVERYFEAVVEETITATLEDI